MPWNDPRYGDPNYRWRIIFLGLLVVLLAILMLGCQSAQKNPEIELWLIDHRDVVLYRKIGAGREQIIPIAGNKDMEKFIVIDRGEYLR